jgi:hypothetical protein
MSSGVGVSEVRGVFVVSDRPDLLVEHKQMLVGVGPYGESFAQTVSRHTVALGTRFRLGGYTLTRASPLGDIAVTSQYAAIVAPEGATVTLRAPATAVLPYWTGSATDTLIVTVGAGESMTVAANQRLDAALVTSDELIVVAAGGRGWAPGGPCGDDGSDLVLPVERYGTEFVVRVPRGSAPDQSSVLVIADTDGTEVMVDGVVVATLAAGATHSLLPTVATSIVTSEPALVWMNAALDGCEVDTAFVPGLDLRPTPLAVTWNSSFDGESVMVVHTASVESLMLDAAPLTTTSSTPVPTRLDLTVVTFDVATGLHRVTSDSGFQLLAASANPGTGNLAHYQPFGVPCEKAGVMCPEPDAGVADAGSADAGSDAGSDSGTPEEDAGSTPFDAGLPPRDAGPPPRDSGGIIRMTEDDGGCCSIAPGAPGPDRSLPLDLGLALLATALVRLQRRRSVRTSRRRV